MKNDLGNTSAFASLLAWISASNMNEILDTSAQLIALGAGLLALVVNAKNLFKKAKD